MAFSSEIEDLEQFIDSYVGPESRTSSSDWSRTQSFDKHADFSHAVQYQLGSTPPTKDTGTEFWGKISDGPQWCNPRQVRNNQDQRIDHRPKIQEREVQQWPPNVQYQQNQSPNFFQHFETPSKDGNQMMHQIPAHMHSSQNPNDIQAIVSDLIRQNNMSKPQQQQQQQQQLPPWIDVSIPPPALLSENPYQNHVQGDAYVNPLDEHGGEPILQSMTFQRSFPDNQYVQSPASHSVIQKSTPTLSQHQTALSQPNLQTMQDWQQHANMCYQEQQYIMHQGHKQQFHESTPPNSNIQYSRGMFQNAALSPQPVHTFKEQNCPGMAVYPHQQSNQHLGNEIPIFTSSHHMKEFKPANIDSDVVPNSHTHGTGDSGDKISLSRKSSNEKYPKSKLRSPSDDFKSSNHHIYPVASAKSNQLHGYQQQLSSEVFENEGDENWTSHKNKVHDSRRKSSAADEDQDWRRRDSGSAEKSISKDTDHELSPEWDARQIIQRRQRESMPIKNQPDENSKRDKTTQWRKRQESTTSSEGEGHRRVTAKGKSKVHSWLENGKASGKAEEEIKKLRISDSETDLTKFIETTQSFATNEAKMREVAEILCNKALKNPKFARNAAILCDRMSWMMVHGTKFRTVVLNVMQGHYKNREQLFSSSFRSEFRWFGFAAFLVEIFLNVRTSTKDRLVVLVEPVFSCLFQVLKSEQVNQVHIECFGLLFVRAGPALESENPLRMNELMAELRDRCVISKTIFVRRVLLDCVERYATKWCS